MHVNEQTEQNAMYIKTEQKKNKSKQNRTKHQNTPFPYLVTTPGNNSSLTIASDEVLSAPVTL
jgi:hypothetical protein